MTIEKKHELCAFCRTVPDEYRDGRIYNIFCRNAHCAIYGHRINVDKWNTRASDDALIKALKAFELQSEAYQNISDKLQACFNLYHQSQNKLEKCLEFIKTAYQCQWNYSDAREILEELGELPE